MSQKVRVFGSWLYQYQRETGVNLPAPTRQLDCLIVSLRWTPSGYPHSVGIRLLTSTPTSAPTSQSRRISGDHSPGLLLRELSGPRLSANGTLYSGEPRGFTQTRDSVNALAGNPLPLRLQQSTGFFNDAFSESLREKLEQGVQFDADLAWFKSGWRGTHNFKFGYQLNRLQNDILQSYNEPYVQLCWESGWLYRRLSSNWRCQLRDPSAICSRSQRPSLPRAYTATADVYDFGTGGDVTSFNHGLFAQDAWTIGHGLTLNAGIRFRQGISAREHHRPA